MDPYAQHDSSRHGLPAQPSGDPPTPPTTPPPAMPQPLPYEMLQELYRLLPVMILQITPDGMVVACNPEVARLTGFASEEIVGKNLWATLFPGRLFTQVPRFISALAPSGFMRDIPLTIRTREGQHRIIAFTRFTHAARAGDQPTVITCIGHDLTDRLTDIDRTVAQINLMPSAPGTMTSASGVMPLPDGGALAEFAASEKGYSQGDADALVDGSFVTPIASTPPAPTGDAAHAIAQVHEFLTHVDGRISELQNAFLEGQLSHVAKLADVLRGGAGACGLLTFSAAAERLHVAATRGQLERVTSSVQELVTLAKRG